MEHIRIDLTGATAMTEFDYSDEANESQIEILGGEFIEGGTVTVSICGKVFTRKVKYSARKWMDLYITVNGYDLSLSEFMNPDDFRDTDYSYILKK